MSHALQTHQCPSHLSGPDILRDMHNRLMFVYLDNILFILKSPEEHVHHVQSIMQHLLENSLFVNPEECEF